MDRQYVAAVCALYLATGKPVESANDPRDLLYGYDWHACKVAGTEGIEEGYFTNVGEPHKLFPDEPPPIDMLVPTAKAYFAFLGNR